MGFMRSICVYIYIHIYMYIFMPAPNNPFPYHWDHYRCLLGHYFGVTTCRAFWALPGLLRPLPGLLKFIGAFLGSLPGPFGHDRGLLGPTGPFGGHYRGLLTGPFLGSLPGLLGSLPGLLSHYRGHYRAFWGHYRGLLK